MGVVFKMVEECNRTGETPEQVHRRWNKKARKIANRDPHKKWGECESCELETVLVREVGLCGPCCFGDSDTAYGNW